MNAIPALYLTHRQVSELNACWDNVIVDCSASINGNRPVPQSLDLTDWILNISLCSVKWHFTADKLYIIFNKSTTNRTAEVKTKRRREQHGEKKEPQYVSDAALRAVLPAHDKGRVICGVQSFSFKYRWRWAFWQLEEAFPAAACTQARRFPRVSSKENIFSWVCEKYQRTVKIPLAYMYNVRWYYADDILSSMVFNTSKNLLLLLSSGPQNTPTSILISNLYIGLKYWVLPLLG